MHRNPVRARLGEHRNKLVGILDHQVAIERQLSRLAQRLHYRRPDREVRDEVAIHDVHVDDMSSALGRGAHLLAQSSEISRKNRRCQFDQPGPSESEYLQENRFREF